MANGHANLTGPERSGGRNDKCPQVDDMRLAGPYVNLITMTGSYFFLIMSVGVSAALGACMFFAGS